MRTKNRVHQIQHPTLELAEANAEEKGLARGMEKGLAKGMEKGRKVEQQSIAANFKRQGIAPEIIAQCTGLSIEEIDVL